jgi:hypothetical protein
MARDRRTRIGARAPGAESNPTPRRCAKESSARHRAGLPSQTTRRTKGSGKPSIRRRMPGAGLSDGYNGKALSDMPAFQPYWGKPAVRNDRGDGGNVGIIRSPLRATVPPDCGGRQATGVPTATNKPWGALSGGFHNHQPTVKGQTISRSAMADGSTFKAKLGALTVIDGSESAVRVTTGDGGV